MAFELWGFQGAFDLSLPPRLAGYLAAGLALIGIALFAARGGQAMPMPRHKRASPTWLLFFALLAAAPLASQTFLVRLPIPAPSAVPGTPAGPNVARVALLGAVPWLLAGGLLGPWQAGAVGLAGGLASAGWGNHSILAPLGTALAASGAAWLLRRDYAGRIGDLLRSPLLAALLGGVTIGLFGIVELYAHSGGSSYDSLGFALGNSGAALAAGVLEAAVGGLAGLLVRRHLPGSWVRPSSLSPAPYQRSLSARLLLTFTGLGLISALVLIVLEWGVARSAAEEAVQTQMVRAATQAGEGIPYFTQTGRSILGDLAARLGPGLQAGALTEPDLAPTLRTIPFFRQIAVFDVERRLAASTPGSVDDATGWPLELEAGADLALSGAPAEVTLSSGDTDQPAQVVFLWPITPEGDSSVIGFVAGWTDLASNPILSPVLRQLTAFSPGAGFIVDEAGTILAHPDPSLVGEAFSLPDIEGSRIYSDPAPDGTLRLVFVYTIPGSPWKVVVTTPQRVVEMEAVRIAAPLVAMVAAIGMVGIGAVIVTSRRLTRPLRQIAAAAEAMARGSLTQPLALPGADEIGRLAGSLERLRRSLRGRLSEMDLLLSASQKLAASFDLRASLPPILSGVRDVIGPEIVRLVVAVEGPPGSGRTEAYAPRGAEGEGGTLDSQIVDLTRRRGRFILENPSRARAVLDLGGLETPLESMMALPLMSEETFVGALWLGHRKAHSYSSDEINLLTILAGQLGVSVANARLFHQAEEEGLRLSAILAATPDAVLVTDRAGRILLANPAAEIVLRGRAEEAIGQTAETWVREPEVLRLLMAPAGERRTSEVSLTGDRVLFATIAEIEPEAAGTSGRVCILGDITHFKKLDALKSEFVSTVSHDLRAPLTLLRGYATMLPMVGSLTEKQREFVTKILGSVDSMSQLVDNLLDLGRIEAGVGLNLEQVRVETVLRDVVGSHRAQAIGKQIALEVDVAEGMQPVEADPTLLRQAVSNLLENAVKYTAPGGRVTVQASQARGRQLITVRDTGVGIAPADQARLFEKFGRSPRKDGGGEQGPGLGLAIVKSIVDQHGGRVSVDSRLGAGSAFTLDLPLHRVEGEAGSGSGPAS
jgi:signal transduction histidine kinase